MAKLNNKMVNKTKGKNLDDSRALVPVNDDKWRAESDMRTLASSAEIMADPKRHKAAKDMAKKEAEKYKRICK